MKRWKDISIAKKLYFVIGIMALLIACELITLKFAMQTLSAVRAFVGGEGLWSKAQKNAAFHLQRFAVTRDEDDFRAFLNHLNIPEGDHQARIEMKKEDPDREVIRRGFVQGRIHPHDVDPMIQLFSRFSREKHLARAIEVWTEADRLIEEFKKEGIRYHALLKSRTPSPKKIRASSERLRILNEQLTEIEDEFSSVLGEGSRWMDSVVIFILLMAVLTVEAIGLTLTVMTSRSIAQNLAEINVAARNIGRGDFSTPLVAKSKDEIGQLAESVEEMRLLLEKSYRHLEQRVKERTADLEQFTIFASHDLKEPLRTISIWIDLLEKELGPRLDDTHREYMRFIVDAAKRMRLLIDALLSYGQIGKRPIVFATVDCEKELNKILDLLSAEIENRRANIIVDPLPSITADGILLGQVFQNLITNALKYHGSSSPEIRITAIEESSQWLFAFQDNGIGISRDDIEKVFKMFQRLENNSGALGSGIGLALCKKIIELHGGRIWAQSEVGKGATFYFSLPKNDKEPVATKINYKQHLRPRFYGTK